MAKVVRDVKQVGQWIEQRQQLEVMLAWDLLERFNARPMMAPLREMAEGALAEMSLMPEDAVEKAIQKEKGRPNMQYLNNQIVLQRVGGPPVVLYVNHQRDLENIWDKNPMPDAQYCSDIIRLYGTCVEECAALHPEYLFLEKQRVSFRKPGQGPQGAGTWLQGKPAEPQGFGRHRKTDGVAFAPNREQTDVGLLPPEQRKPDLIHRFGASGQPQIQNAKLTEVHRFLISQQGGQSGIELKDTSTVGRINRVFGTVPAGDISGTTTDTLFFFRRMTRFLPGGVLDPIYYLLPAATIVAGAHHSLLEVALALSLNAQTTIDYHIGYYETLMPNRAGRPQMQGADEIKKSLAAAEHHRFNHHMLVFYEGAGKLAGCFKFEGEAPTRTFKNFAKATDAEARFRTMPFWPTEDDILKAWPKRYFFE